MNEVFAETLINIIGLNEGQRQLLVDQSLTDETTLALLDEDAINDLFSKRPFTTASIITKMRLKALRLWLQEKEDIDAEYSVNDFDENECKEMLKKMSRKSSSSSVKERNKKSDVKAPDKFNGKQRNWKSWKAEFEAYLSALRGDNGTPLSYIIRDDDDMTEEELNDLEGPAKEIYEAPLQGTYFERDNYQVFQHLRTQIVGSSAETHIESYEKKSDGRSAWLFLKTKYEGEDARNAAIAVARKEISSASWERNLKNWSFDDYCLKHTRANNTLSKYGVPVDGPSQVRAFLDGIHNREMDSVKSNVMFDAETKGDLGKAIIKFKDTTSALNLVSSGRYSQEDHRRIGSASRGGRSTGRGGQRDGRNKRPYDQTSGYRGGRGGGGGRGYHGRGRYQPQHGRGRGQEQPDDGLRLDKAVLDQMNSKQRAAFYKGRDAMRTPDDNNTTRTIAGVQSNYTQPVDEISAMTDAQTNAQMNAASSQFGKEGNRSLNNRKQGAIISGERFISSARSAKKAPQYDYNQRSRAEIDSRADTVCAGSTFRLLEESSQYCNVSGFHSDMKPMQNVPVATVATAYDDPVSQETYVLVFFEALYFGDTMEHSLISPMQLRHNGLRVDQTPRQYDPQSNHGITFPQDDEHDLFIPFHLHGCISYFSTRLPTDSEMHRCRHVYMTEDATWDPYSDCFRQAELPFAFIHKSSPANTSARAIYGASRANRRCNIEPSLLAKRLGISVYNAEMTLNTTTQLAVHNVSVPMSQRVRTRQAQLRHPRLACRIYSDTLFSDQKSLLGSTCAQAFLAGTCGFSDVYGMPTKAEAGDKLNTFVTTYGIPEEITTDGAKEETLGTWNAVRKKFLIHQSITEPHTPQQNKTEIEIKALKNHYRRIMHNHSVPEALWDFGLKHTARIRSHVARDSLGGRTPLEIMTGQTPDISEIMHFGFYDWVKYYDPAAFPSKREFLGRWLGPAPHVGQALCYYILKENGQVIARSTVRLITTDELSSPDETKLRDEFTKQVGAVIGDFDGTLILEEPNDEPEIPLAPPDEPNEPQPNEPQPEPDTRVGIDPLIHASIILPRGDRSELGRVLDRKRNADGLYIGRKHKLPTLDSRVYVIEFADGEQVDVSYNTLAEHLYSQVDSEGHQYQIFKEIVNHRKGKAAVDKADQYTHYQGKKSKKKTTAGWDLEVEWKDGSTSWLSLKELKNSNAVEVAQYAIENRIDLEPAFDWWVHDVIKRKQRLIKMSQSYRLRTGYKFGLRVPNTVEEALEIDKERGDTLWQDAINKEMKNVRIAFDIRSDKTAPPGFQLIPHNIIFEIKMDFTRKACLVAGGHKTTPPTQLTYSSVVSRESVRLGFLVAALNDVDIVAADVGNAYLNATTKEKVYIITGPEFGPLDQGKVAVIVRALYGLKSSGAMWRSHFAAHLREMGFTSSLGDPDVWLRAAEKPDKTEYYEYILVYVDDLLIISHQADSLLHVFENHYKYRLKDVGPPKRYLGATIERIDVDGMKTWSMSAREYLEKAIPVIEEHFGTLKQNNKITTPLPKEYHPELDTSDFLNDELIEVYQSYMGILRWAVELGRIDLAHAASLMARFQAAPRSDHLTHVLGIFSYVKKHLQSRIVFDYRTRDWSNIPWTSHEWKEYYPDSFETVPNNAPPSRGKAVQINMFCDACHATDLITRRSTTGIIIFVQGTPILWYSKRQNTIETSTFGSEFVALKIATEMVEGFRYRLRMMGIPINGPVNTFCDNDSVVKNVTNPASTLAKKHNAIAYHKVRESVAAEVQRIAFEPGKYNLSDMLTKLLSGPLFKACCTRIFQ
jgi:hypothetical protein